MPCTTKILPRFTGDRGISAPAPSQRAKATDFLWKSRQHLESWQWKTGKEKGKEAVIKQRACTLRRIKYVIKNENNEILRYVRLQMRPETETIPQRCSVCRLKYTMNYKLCLGLLIADSYNIVPFKKRSAQLTSWSVEEIAEVRSEPIKEYEIVARWYRYVKTNQTRDWIVFIPF